MSYIEKLFEKYKSLDKSENYEYADFLVDQSENILSDISLFDSEWYLVNYPDVCDAGWNPIEHYLKVGINEDCNPNPFFDSTWYNNYYKDVKKSKLDPFVHYTLYGKNEGRAMSFSDLIFDSSDWVSHHQIEKILKALNTRVSIIVPVFKSFDKFKRCITSVLRYTTGVFELIIIDDCSNDEQIDKYLISLKNKKNIKIIKNDVNKGYIKSINEGIINSKYDVVLLNSDTVVTSKWLQKLIVLAYLKDNIGTVTPISNDAGAFSVPKVNENNNLPNGLKLEIVSNIIEKSSKRVFMEVPTGNGFCMYIKRDVIISVGLFDEESFGLGYGEENDFCIKARKKGWVNMMDDSTYIFHEKGSSFGEKREKLIKEHGIILNNRYPNYKNDIDNFLNSSKLKDVQITVYEGFSNYLTNNTFKNRVLYISNSDLNNNLSWIQEKNENYFLNINGKESYISNFRDNDFIIIEKLDLSLSSLSKNFNTSKISDVIFNIILKYSIDGVLLDSKLKDNQDLFEILNKYSVSFTKLK